MATITNKCGAVLYGWSGGFGSVLVSEEHVTVGTVRVLFGELMYAAGSDHARWSMGLSAATDWVPVRPIDVEWIRSFRERFING